MRGDVLVLLKKLQRKCALCWILFCAVCVLLILDVSYDRIGPSARINHHTQRAIIGRIAVYGHSRICQSLRDLNHSGIYDAFLFDIERVGGDLSRAYEIYTCISSMKIPTVSVIHRAIGGGYLVALASNYIATSGPMSIVGIGDGAKMLYSKDDKLLNQESIDKRNETYINLVNSIRKIDIASIDRSKAFLTNQALKLKLIDYVSYHNAIEDLMRKNQWKSYHIQDIKMY